MFGVDVLGQDDHGLLWWQHIEITFSGDVVLPLTFGAACKYQLLPGSAPWIRGWRFRTQCLQFDLTHSLTVVVSFFRCLEPFWLRPYWNGPPGLLAFFSFG